MRAHVNYQLELSYSEPVRSANQILRLTPRACDSLHVLDWFVGVEPLTTLRRSEDGFGNIVLSCSHEGPLEKIVIGVEGLIETQDSAGVLRGVNEKQPLDLFLRHSEGCAADKDLRAFAAEAVAGEDERLGRLHRLMAAVHEAVAFAPGGSGAPRPAPAVFAAKTATARETAQVFVAAARALAIPARFVSGFRLEDVEAAQDHAWAEAYVENIGWIGFDATLDLCPRDLHLRLAHGVDYFSAAPRRGAFSATRASRSNAGWTPRRRVRRFGRASNK